MRLIAALLTLVALALAALAGHGLWQELTRPPAAPMQSAASGTGGGEAPSAPQKQARRWPALFGEKQPPRPPAPPKQSQAEPQPPRPPKPPIDSLGYHLKGVVQAGNATWAMVSHPSGEQLVRAGDTLREGVTVARIDRDGIWVSRDGDAPELLAFTE